MSYDLKNEEDLKLYLKNLHIEYSFGCLSEKNPEACHLLGEYYEAIKQNFKESAKIHKNNCDAHGYGRSCTKFGRFSAIGRLISIPSALKHLSKEYNPRIAVCDTTAIFSGSYECRVLSEIRKDSDEVLNFQVDDDSDIY